MSNMDFELIDFVQEVFDEVEVSSSSCTEGMDKNLENASTTNFFSISNSDSDQDQEREVTGVVLSSCLVCNTDINSQCQSSVTLEEEAYKTASLTTLCDVLNMPNVFQLFTIRDSNSGGINDCYNINQVFEDPNNFCKSCANKIFSATVIAEEIKNLQLRQQTVVRDLKQLISSCYNSCDNREISTEDKSSNSDYKKVLSHVVRQTFSQCWSNCRVSIPKLAENESHSILTTRKQTKPRLQVTKLSQPYSRQERSKRELSRFDDIRSQKAESTNTFDDSNYKDAVIIDLTESLDCISNDSYTHDSGLKAQGNNPIECDSGNQCLPSENTIQSQIPYYRRPRKLIISRREKIGNECRHCGIEFKHEEVTVYENSKELFICNLPNCLKKFKTLDLLKRHHVYTCPTKLLNKKLIKLGRISWNCDICGKKFKLRSTLKHHQLAKHEQKFNFFCEICGQGALTPSMLARHMVSHTTEKQIQCDECGYICKRPSQLLYHKRTHTNELPHLCQICGRGFTSNNKLQQHMVSHSTTKDFPCPLCGKLFASKTYVTNHINSFHKKIPRKVNPKSSMRRRKIPNENNAYEFGQRFEHNNQTVRITETSTMPTVSHVKELSYEPNSNISLLNHILVHVADPTILSHISETH